MTKIPFKWLPASWGLKGKPYDVAEANYYWAGRDLEYKLLSIDKKYGLSDKDFSKNKAALDYKYGNMTDYEFELELAKINNDGTVPAKKMLELEFEHHIIDEYDYDKSKIFLKIPDKESIDHKVGLLEVDFKHVKIKKNFFEKSVATLKEEPWIDIIDHGFDPAQGINGVYFEFDWNEYWVDFLRKNGYIGLGDEQIVEQWFSDVCRSQVEHNPLENIDPIPFNSSHAITRKHPGDGSTGYS